MFNFAWTTRLRPGRPAQAKASYLSGKIVDIIAQRLMFLAPLVAEAKCLRLLAGA